MKHFITLVIFVFSVSAQAQTLFVSDIDDTIKLANIKDITDAAFYAFDDESRFMGMNVLYDLLARENSDMHIVYLSRAPEWLMRNTHRAFLENGRFPKGTYIGRTSYDSDVHKIKNLRKLMDQYRPRKVILIGDNGEHDADVYAQLVSEYANQGIEFHQFIRIVYSDGLFSQAAKLHPGQVGFVTPVEISLELEKERLLSAQTVETFINKLVPKILRQRPYGDKGEVAFPYFLECYDFQWKWDESLTRFDILKLLKNRIEVVCEQAL